LVPLSSADLLVNARGTATSAGITEFRWRCTPEHRSTRFFGRLSFSRRSRLRQGVDFDGVTNTDLFFVTLEKTAGHYSPSTMYRDYAISSELFHWESQSTTSVESPTGQRYLNHRTRGSHVVLFGRHRKHEGGRTAVRMPRRG